MMAAPLSVLVVGGGMYVSGRGVDGYRGTILPALLEERRQGRVGPIAIATTNAQSAAEAASSAVALGGQMGVDGTCAAFPRNGNNHEAFLAAADASSPDAAIVAVPDRLHAVITVPLIERGIPCLVVKPMAGTRADAEAMLNAARRAGVVAQIEFHKRLDESNLLLRHAIAAGEIGTPLYATVEYSQRKSVPRDLFRAWSADTSIFQYLAVHYVDLISWATEFRPISAFARGQKQYLVALGIDTWDAIQAMIEWRRPDGGTFVLSCACNWIDPDRGSAMSDQRVSIVGTAGRFDADQKHRGVQIVTDKDGLQDVNPYFTGAWLDGAGRLTFQGYGIASVRQFLGDVADVRGGRATPDELDRLRPSFADGIVSTAVVEAVHDSLRSGGAVEVRL